MILENKMDILSTDNLQCRGFTLANRCWMCKEKEESVNHLLIHCEMARDTWNMLLTLFGRSWAFPSSVKDLLCDWQGARVRKDAKKAWLMAPSCLFWCIWRERNRRVFDGEEMSPHRFKGSFLSLFHFWMLNGHPPFVESLHDFLDSLRL
uniref:Reverse transcriptase zinc-binding domain-containing protein n=1 Tax=Davidia involucrata TaxID=16924 RepID=A0A5B6Z489_DAVIN